MIKAKTKEYESKLDRLLEEAIRELNKIGIEPSKTIHTIVLNRRAKKRLGCCKKVLDRGKIRYEIEVALWMMSQSDFAIKEVIIHELLHSCKGCLNHGKLWKAYAAKVGDAYGYKITTTSKEGEAAVVSPGLPRAYRYKIVCTKCGITSGRMKRSKVVERPELYQCSKCGGKLEVETL